MKIKNMKVSLTMKNIFDLVRREYSLAPDTVLDVVIEDYKDNQKKDEPSSVSHGVSDMIGELNYRLRVMKETGNKILAIKLWREVTGDGLKDAKDSVELDKVFIPNMFPNCIHEEVFVKTMRDILNRNTMIRK
jgi:hypothetical protein